MLSQPESSTSSNAVIQLFYTAHDFMMDFPWEDCRKIYTSPDTSILVPLSFLHGQAQEDADFLIISAFTDANTIVREWLHIQQNEKSSTTEEFLLFHSTELLCQILCRAYHYRHDSYFMILAIVYLIQAKKYKQEDTFTSFMLSHYSQQPVISITTIDFALILSLSLLKIQELVHIHLPLAIEAANQLRSKKSRRSTASREFRASKLDANLLPCANPQCFCHEEALNAVPANIGPHYLIPLPENTGSYGKTVLKVALSSCLDNGVVNEQPGKRVDSITVTTSTTSAKRGRVRTKKDAVDDDKIAQPSNNNDSSAPPPTSTKKRKSGISSSTTPKSITKENKKEKNEMAMHDSTITAEMELTGGGEDMMDITKIISGENPDGDEDDDNEEDDEEEDNDEEEGGDGEGEGGLVATTGIKAGRSTRVKKEKDGLPSLSVNRRQKINRKRYRFFILKQSHILKESQLINIQQQLKYQQQIQDTMNAAQRMKELNPMLMNTLHGGMGGGGNSGGWRPSTGNGPPPMSLSRLGGTSNHRPYLNPGAAGSSSNSGHHHHGMSGTMYDKMRTIPPSSIPSAVGKAVPVPSYFNTMKVTPSGGVSGGAPGGTAGAGENMLTVNTVSNIPKPAYTSLNTPYMRIPTTSNPYPVNLIPTSASRMGVHHAYPHHNTHSQHQQQHQNLGFTPSKVAQTFGTSSSSSAAAAYGAIPKPVVTTTTHPTSSSMSSSSFVGNKQPPTTLTSSMATSSNIFRDAFNYNNNNNNNNHKPSTLSNPINTSTMSSNNNAPAVVIAKTADSVVPSSSSNSSRPISTASQGLMSKDTMPTVSNVSKEVPETTSTIENKATSGNNVPTIPMTITPPAVTTLTIEAVLASESIKPIVLPQQSSTSSTEMLPPSPTTTTATTTMKTTIAAATVSSSSSSETVPTLSTSTTTSKISNSNNEVVVSSATPSTALSSSSGPPIPTVGNTQAAAPTAAVAVTASTTTTTTTTAAAVNTTTDVTMTNNNNNNMISNSSSNKPVPVKDSTTIDLSDTIVSEYVSIKGVVALTFQRFRVQLNAFRQEKKKFSRNTTELTQALWIFEVCLLISDHPYYVEQQLKIGNYHSLIALRKEFAFFHSPLEYYIELGRRISTYEQSKNQINIELLSIAIQNFDELIIGDCITAQQIVAFQETMEGNPTVASTVEYQRMWTQLKGVFESKTSLKANQVTCIEVFKGIVVLQTQPRMSMMKED